jgi:hypothetical protein
MGLVAIPIARHIVPPKAETIGVVSISPYLLKLPPAKDVARGGGGGGARQPELATQGKLPRFVSSRIYPTIWAEGYTMPKFTIQSGSAWTSDGVAYQNGRSDLNSIRTV